MTTLLSIVLVLGALTFVAWPFLQSADGAETDRTDPLSPLERQKVEALTAIKEAEFDFKTGKLSDADYQALVDRYRQQALAAIGAIEESARTTPRGQATAKAAGSRVKFCPHCGNRTPPRANFCGSCGGSLREAVA